MSSSWFRLALVVPLLVGFSSLVRAEEAGVRDMASQVGVSPTETSRLLEDRLVSASFNLGQARLIGTDIDSRREGQGLAFGFRIDFWRLIGVGMETQMMQLNVRDEIDRSEGGIGVLPYLSANLIQFDYEKFAFNGALTSAYAVGGVASGFHAGASFDFIYDRKVGVRVDLRTGGPLMGALNTVSLTGYY